MYNTPKILKDLRETQAIVSRAIAKLEGSQKDVNKFYKKGYKTTGTRVRKNLRVIVDDLNALRSDILRMQRERKAFKDTELNDDFK